VYALDRAWYVVKENAARDAMQIQKGNNEDPSGAIIAFVLLPGGLQLRPFPRAA
jgi:hypothetical protein